MGYKLISMKQQLIRLLFQIFLAGVGIVIAWILITIMLIQLNIAVSVNYVCISYIAILVIYLMYIYHITLKLVNIWEGEFLKLEKITYEIKNHNLDFNNLDSNISEFSHLIKSMINMKEIIKDTLFSGWKLEKEKDEEIAALAHDIKIPLTIIKGSIELVLKNDSNPYTTSHLEDALDAVEKIEKYEMFLIEYVKKEKYEADIKESVVCDQFSEKIKMEIGNYAKNIGVDVSFLLNHVEGNIIIDYLSMERTILNIISNAIAYKVKDDRILCCFEEKEEKYSIAICNQHGHFKEDMITNSTKLFFTTNNDSSLKHYGLGLAYALRVVKKHKGDLKIQNTEELGAVVYIRLPLHNTKL